MLWLWQIIDSFDQGLAPIELWKATRKPSLEGIIGCHNGTPYQNTKVVDASLHCVAVDDITDFSPILGAHHGAHDPVPSDGVPGNHQLVGCSSGNCSSLLECGANHRTRSTEAPLIGTDLVFKLIVPVYVQFN